MRSWLLLLYGPQRFCCTSLMEAFRKTWKKKYNLNLCKSKRVLGGSVILVISSIVKNIRRLLHSRACTQPSRPTFSRRLRIIKQFEMKETCQDSNNTALQLTCQPTDASMHANNWLYTSLDWCCRPQLSKRRRSLTRSTYPPTKVLPRSSGTMTVRFHQDMTLLYSNHFQFWRNLIWNLPPHPANTSKDLSFGTVSLGLLTCLRFCSSVWQADLAFPFPFPLPYMG